MTRLPENSKLFASLRRIASSEDEAEAGIKAFSDLLDEMDRDTKDKDPMVRQMVFGTLFSALEQEGLDVSDAREFYGIHG